MGIEFFIIPPPSTFSPSYKTTGCPGVIALTGLSKTTEILSYEIRLRVASLSIAFYLIFALILILSSGVYPLVQLI